MYYVNVVCVHASTFSQSSVSVSIDKTVNEVVKEYIKIYNNNNLPFKISYEL